MVHPLLDDTYILQQISPRAAKRKGKIALYCCNMITNPIFQCLVNTPTFLVPATVMGCTHCLQNPLDSACRKGREPKGYRERRLGKIRGEVVCWALLPVDPWAPNIDSESIASQLFAFSLFPYLGFLYFITKSKSAPKLTLFGFYFLLAFVGATSEFLRSIFLCIYFSLNVGMCRV